MLDPRVYRAAFVPLLLALFVAAFSLERRPPALTTPLGTEIFDAGRALRDAESLSRAYPERAPGSAQDEELAARVGRTLSAAGFEVSRSRAGETQTVVAVRPGVTSRRVVVTADRAADHSPGLAEMTGTAALLELGRIFRTSGPSRSAGEDRSRALGRDLRRTLVLVSTSGASLGAGGDGTRALLEAAGPARRLDAVLSLGDVGGGLVRKPWVVPWAGDGSAGAPLGLRRTVEAAARTETASLPGAARASGQWARRAFGLTVSAQGEPAAAGLPAVLLQASGERGPEARTPVLEPRLRAFGAAALRVVSAVDGVGAPAAGSTRREPADGGPAAFPAQTAGIVTVRRVLPDWAVRLLVGAALLPALLGAFDGFFRVRRRGLSTRSWLAWTAAAALPLLVAYGWLRLLDTAGALAAPPAPALPGTVAFGWAEAVAVVSTVVLLGLVAAGVHRGLRASSQGRGDLTAGGAASAVGVIVAVVAGLVWLANPYAAALLVPAAHAWLLVTDPGSRLNRPAALAVAGLGLVPLVALVAHDASALGIGPAGAAWLAVLLAAGGHLGVLAATVLALVTACFVRTLAVVAARGRLRRVAAAAEAALPPPPRVRGPGSYAGPGSLGGTESALRR